MTGGSQLPCDSLLDYCPWESWKWGVETSSEDGDAKGGGGNRVGDCAWWLLAISSHPGACGLSFMGLVGLSGPVSLCLSFPTAWELASLSPAAGMRSDDGKPGKLGDTVMTSRTQRDWPGHLDFQKLTSGMAFMCAPSEGLGQVQADGCPPAASADAGELLS